MSNRRDVIVGIAGASALGAALPTAVQAAPPAMRLGSIVGVTTTAEDLKAVEAAYTAHLGYTVADRGRVSTTTATRWGAPAVSGRPYLILQPQSGHASFLRFVEQAMPASYKPMTTRGWNSTEIIIESPDKLAERLEHSPFKIVGEPHDLTGLPDIRAMQVIGPANEVLYLTATKRPMPEMDMPVPGSFVDRVFICPLASDDFDALLAFYADVFGNPARGEVKVPLTVASSLLGVPADTRYRLSVVPLGNGTKLELDGYPMALAPRPRPPGGLPVGMAMVTFASHALDSVQARLVAPAAPADMEPMKGGRAGVLVGSAGELIELVEA